MPVTQSINSDVYGSAVTFPRWVDEVVLGAGTAEAYVIPTEARFAIITCDGAVYARITGTAAVPTTEVTDGSGSQLITAGAQYRVEGGSTLSLIRAGSSSVIVTIACYKS